MITEEEKAVEIGKRLTKPFALTFQEIEGWSMYELRQQMDQRKIVDFVNIETQNIVRIGNK